MTLYFEDLAEDLQAHCRGGARWRWLALGASALVLVASMTFSDMAPILVLLMLCAWMLAGLAFAVIGKLRSRQIQVHCPQCHEAIRADSAPLVLKTRACQRCQYVFPSKLPPVMRRVQLDRAHLPRIWLQGEVPTATLAGDDETANASAENPYQTPAPVQDTRAPAQSSLHAWGTLLWWWYKVTTGPVQTLLASDEQLLANTRLTVPREVETERSARMKACFLRGLRRQAWMQIACINVPTLVAMWLAWQSVNPQQDPVWVIALWLVGAHAVATLFCGILYGLMNYYAPAELLNFLNGGLNVIDAEVDAETGYYGIRWRLIGVHRQGELPALKFQLRQQLACEMLLRVVNYDLAEALELPLPYATPGEWIGVEVDLLQMVRQSAPEFFGDEIHLTGDPTGQIEMRDYRIIAR